MNHALLLFSLLFLSGCAHSVHQVYVSSQDASSAGKGSWITAESQDFVILNFQRDTTYIEKAYAQLERKCPGRIAAVTTEHLTSFKLLSYEQKVVVKGLCVKGFKSE